MVTKPRKRGRLIFVQRSRWHKGINIEAVLLGLAQSGAQNTNSNSNNDEGLPKKKSVLIFWKTPNLQATVLMSDHVRMSYSQKS
jgi:hypothetical protein